MNRSEARTAAERLVAQMTIEEKVSQLQFDAPAIERLGIPAYHWWNEATHGVAHAGTATVFPCAIGLASVFDEDLHAEIAAAIGKEARAKYNMYAARNDRESNRGLTLRAPNVTIYKDPRQPHGEQTYGEDPFLTARLGARFVRALQGDGRYLQAAACVCDWPGAKGREAAESAYDRADTDLPAFEACIKEGHAIGVMGNPQTADRVVLKATLRNQWGFDGVWLNHAGTPLSHLARETPENIAYTVQAGYDVHGIGTAQTLLDAYSNDLISDAMITEAAIHAFTCRYQLGLFDSEAPFLSVPYDEVDGDAHARLALSAARRSMVLLKNNGVLPLSKSMIHNIAVIGPTANDIRITDGDAPGTASRAMTFLAGIQREFSSTARVRYAVGCAGMDDNSTESLARANDRIAEAIQVAEMSDVVLLCLGWPPASTHADIQLPASQERLMADVLQTGKPVVVILTTGSAVAVSEGDAILETWYPGQAGAIALADLLVGRTSPSGRLPITFYEKMSDLPPVNQSGMAGRTYRYATCDALYPFGFGLSYARFEYGVPQYDALTGTLSVRVRNIGSFDAEEVVQVYIRPESPVGPGLRHRLCAFGRVLLHAGEEKRVRLPIPPSAFEFVDQAGVRQKIGTDFHLFVGGGQPDRVTARWLGSEAKEIVVTLEE